MDLALAGPRSWVQPFPGVSERVGDFPIVIMWLELGLSEQRGRDRLSRQGQGGSLVGILVAGHRDLCPLEE